MKNILILLFLTICSLNVFAQDPLFNQKTGNINHFNPALVGVQSDFGAQVNYNNQWPSVIRNPVTYSLLINYNLKTNLGVGLELKRDQYGYISTNDIKANINYQQNFGKLETCYGFNLGAGQRKIDLNQFTFEDQINPDSGFVNPTAEPLASDPKNYFTLDIGAAGYYKGFLLGVGVHQVNQPNTSLFASSSMDYPSRLVVNLGYMHSIDDFFQLAALSTFQHQGNFTMLENQLYGQYHFVKLGVGNRMHFGEFGNADFFSASLGIQFHKFSVGYSYEDTPFDDSRGSLGGTHQATAAWYIKGLNREKGMSKFMNVIL